MLNLQHIYKPRTRDEALEFLKQPGAALLAGGTDLVASRRKDVQAVIDLSDLELAFIGNQAQVLAIGAMTRIAEIAGSQILQHAANGIVAQAAQRTKTSILRHQATIGGTLISEPGGILATALAALDARVTLARAGSEPSEGEFQLAGFLADLSRLLPGALLTEVRIPASSLERRAGIVTVARTPLDTPIVSVAASVEITEGKIASAAIALGGVTESVMRVLDAESKLAGQNLSDALIEQTAREMAARLYPFSDFRGSAEYRREMARVLTVRVMHEILPEK